MSDKHERVATRAERTRVHPAVIRGRILGQAVGGRDLGRPGQRVRHGPVHVGHVRAEDATLEIGPARHNQRITRVPVQAQRGRSDLLLDVLRHPEALIRLVVAHAYAAVATAHRKLLLY